MAGVRGWEIHYLYDSPHKDASARVCVCVYRWAHTHGADCADAEESLGFLISHVVASSLGTGRHFPHQEK